MVGQKQGLFGPQAGCEPGVACLARRGLQAPAIGLNFKFRALQGHLQRSADLSAVSGPAPGLLL